MSEPKMMTMDDAVRLQDELNERYRATLAAETIERDRREVKRNDAYLEKSHAQLLERDAIVAKANDARMERVLRADAAATILAALMALPSSLASTETPEARITRLTSTAVALADALRDALAGKAP